MSQRRARGVGMSAVDKMGPARRFFMQEAGGATSDPGLTGIFASGLVADTRLRMEAVNVDALIPWKTIRLSFYLCLLVVAAFLALFAGWPDFRVGAERLLTPGAVSTYTTVKLEDAPASFKDHENPFIAAVVTGRPAAAHG